MLDGLTEIENNEWRDVVNIQRGWLGQLNGTQMEFDLVLFDQGNNIQQANYSNMNERLIVFTKYPVLAVADLISYIEIGPDSIFYSDEYRMVCLHIDTWIYLEFKRFLFICFNFTQGKDLNM